MAERRIFQSTKLMSYLTKIKATFTLVFGTGIFTSAAHGLNTGDVVLLSNSGGALPAGLTNTTRYYVQVIDVNTFYLYTDSYFTTLAPATGNGTGTNSFNLKCKVFDCTEFKSVGVAIFSANNANLTLKCQGTIMDSVGQTYEGLRCDFYKAQSPTNRWSYFGLVDLDTKSHINGATGLTPAGTDIAAHYEVDVNTMKQLCFEIPTFTAGNLEIQVTPFEY